MGCCSYQHTTKEHQLKQRNQISLCKICQAAYTADKWGRRNCYLAKIF